MFDLQPLSNSASKPDVVSAGGREAKLPSSAYHPKVPKHSRNATMHAHRKRADKFPGFSNLGLRADRQGEN